MKNLRPISRVIIINSDKNEILLARNKDVRFWYCPGGGWEYQDENILEAAKREVMEEVGLNVEIGRLVYAQEFHESENTIYFETFWLAYTDQVVPANHKSDGMVEELRWFSKEDLIDMEIFPKRLKKEFWEELGNIEKLSDPFIGVS